MKKLLKSAVIFSFILVILITFSSCAGRLNAEFTHKGETNEDNLWIDFYGINQFRTFSIEYNSFLDAYQAITYSGTYKIYKDKNAPENLLIEFNCGNAESAIYSYEETRHDDGSMTIKIDGVEFKSTEDHPSGYAFKKFLRNMGWIE